MSRDLFDLMTGNEPDAPKNGGVDVTKLDFDLVLHYDNPARAAILVSETGDESSAVWLAKSQIVINGDGKPVPAIKKDGQRATLPVIKVSVPEWLAKSKGLI